MGNITQLNGLLIDAATASFTISASYATTAGSVVGSVATASLALRASGSLTGSLLGTSSWASNTISSSYAATASYSNTLVASATNGSAGDLKLVNSANVVLQTIFLTASLANTASYSTTLGANLKNSGFTLALQASDGTQLSSLSSLNITSVTASIFSGSAFTGSLFGTASWASNAITASFVTGSIFTSTNPAATATRAGSASYADTASYSLNLGATIGQNAAGTVQLRNSAGTTISSINVNTLTASLAYSSSFLYPGTYAVTASWANNALTASFLPINTYNITASWATNALTASFLLGSVTSASFASTASFANRLNQDVIITGSLTVGSSSLGPNENTITLGARDAASEGGQIGFNAPGGTYTSASMIDVYQNRLRILKGTNAGSTAEVAWWSMHNLQMALPGYSSATAFQGTPTAKLTVDSSGNILTSAVDAASTTVYVAHGNGTTAANSLSYTCYLGGTPVSITSMTNAFGSAANAFMPGYPMAAAGTASGLIINMRTTGSATSAYRYYISNFNTSTTGSVVTMAAGHAAGVYSGSVGQVTFNQGDALFFMISSTFVAGASPSGQLTTATFKYTTN